MKNKLLTAFICAAAAIGAACEQPATNTATSNNTANNSAMNQNGMNHNGMDHANMNHSNMNQNANTAAAMPHDHSMMESAPNAASAPYDLQFLDTMAMHHKGAVDMSKMIDARTENPELKKFGQQVVADQQKEITQMKAWREKWFAGKPSAMNMDMAGMRASMKMDMPRLTNSKNKDFDIAFVEMMIPHHEGAIVMSREALQKSEKPEIKELANQIIRAQEAEIKMMQDWKTKWAQ